MTRDHLVLEEVCRIRPVCPIVQDVDLELVCHPGRKIHQGKRVTAQIPISLGLGQQCKGQGPKKIVGDSLHT